MQPPPSQLEAAAARADDVGCATLNLLDLPDLVLYELFLRLEWNDALMLAATSHALRDLVLSHEHVMRLVLLELVPLVTSAPAVSLRPQAALAQCANPVDYYALRAALANESNGSGHEDEDNIEDDDAGEQEEEEGGMVLDTADELTDTAHSGEIQPCGPAADPSTEAQMVLDALTQQISARQHQLRIEQQNFWSVFGQADLAIVRAVQKNVVVLSHAEKVVASDRFVMSILEVKLPTPDAVGGLPHDVFILNIMYFQLAGEDSVVRAQASCRRRGATAKPSLIFGNNSFTGCHGVLDKDLLTQFAKALCLPLDAQRMAYFFAFCASGHLPLQYESSFYAEEQHQLREEPLLAPPSSIRLDHLWHSPKHLSRLSRSINSLRYRLKVPQAYIASLELDSVALSDVERVLPYILRGQGECCRMEVINDLSVQCHAKIHLAVPGEPDYLVLNFKFSSQEGRYQDITTIALSAEASSNSLGARFRLDCDSGRPTIICSGMVRAYTALPRRTPVPSGGGTHLWAATFRTLASQ